MRKAGVEVFVVMSESATRFIAPFDSGDPFAKSCSYFILGRGFWMATRAHRLGRSGRPLLVAPATANQLANFANGRAPDILGAIYLATRAPVLIAPAMNGKMFDHPATQHNLKILQERGVRFVDPIVGELACGYEGVGKLAAVTDIFNDACSSLSG